MDITTILGIIVIVLFVIVFGVWIYWQIKQKGLKQFAVDLIIKAEQEFEHGDNKTKLEFVVNGLKSIIPTPFNLFITTEYVEGFVEKVFALVKNALDYTPSEK